MEKNNKIKNINEYKKEKRNKHKKKKRKKLKKRIMVFFAFAGILGVVVGNICGYVVVSELKYDIHYLKKELRTQEIKLGEEKAKFNTSSSIHEIEKRAKEELNMDYPKKDQIRYIEIKE